MRTTGRSYPLTTTFVRNAPPGRATSNRSVSPIRAEVRIVRTSGHIVLGRPLIEDPEQHGLPLATRRGSVGVLVHVHMLVGELESTAFGQSVGSGRATAIGVALRRHEHDQLAGRARGGCRGGLP